MLLLAVRLFKLQVLQGSRFKKKALNNKQQIIRRPSYRGEIYIQNNKSYQKIVKNVEGFSLFLLPSNFPQKKEKRQKLISKICSNFSINTNKIKKILQKGRWNPYRSYLLKPFLPFEKVLFLAENLDSFPGLFYQDTPRRVYKNGEVYSHITGYVRQISTRELKKKYHLGYSRNSVIGKLGIEKQYDLNLRGKDGFKTQIVDARNRVKKVIIPEDGKPIPGNDIYLTINKRIQNIVYNMMQRYPGGCIVSRPATGEILALYSYPSYDPNIFIGGLDKEKYTKYTNNKDLPFFNRVTQGEYPPSSTFKIVVSCAGLADDEISFWGDYYYCKGGIQIGPQYFKCEGYHKSLNMCYALAYSCNSYYYHLGIDIGPQKIIKYADYFKFGRLSGIDLPYERKGRVPTLRWKREIHGNFWWDGDTANLSIGQGYLLATMVQLNVMTCAMANGGYAYKPHLLKKITSAGSGKEIFTYRPEISFEIPIEYSKIKKIQLAMRKVVQVGTASKGAKSSLAIAGKTGTAQNIQGQAHAWFTCYAPWHAQNPEDKIAVTVFIEHGGSGGGAAAPFATAILNSIFYKNSVLYNYKKIMQSYTSKAHYYEEWLRKRNQEKLPPEYFKRK